MRCGDSTGFNAGSASGLALKVIFLDVDGVLSAFGVRGLCGSRLDLFAGVVKQTGAAVVLSSTWRLPHCRDQLRRLLQELSGRGVELFGMTPVLNAAVGSAGLVQGVLRGDEIRAWLTAAAGRYEIQAVVILDDDPNDELGDLKPRLVKCDGYEGLTAGVAAEVVRRLNEGGEGVAS